MLKNLKKLDIGDVKTGTQANDDDFSKLSNSNKIAKLGLVTIIIGFGGFLLWASMAPLDQGVPSLGNVVLDTKRKIIQHPQGGIVSTVLVHEGDEVSTGQSLLKMDDASTNAMYQGVRQQYWTLKITESRLLSDLNEKLEIIFSKDILMASESDIRLKNQIDIQKQLLNSKRVSLNANLASINETSKGFYAVVLNSEIIENNLRLQLSTLDKELLGIKELVQGGLFPLNKQYEMERIISSLKSQLAENQSLKIKASQSILEIKQREIGIKSDYKKEIEQQLSQLKPELQVVTDRLRAASDEIGRLEIKSPADGQVVGLAVQTVGGVIQSGQKLMEIVPKDESLIIEAKLQPNLIDRVNKGDDVDLRFSTFSNTPQLVVSGIVLTLSSDVITEPGNPTPFYLARIAVTKEGIIKLGDRALQPGMPVEAIFKTGKRTLIDYLLSPLTKRMSSALKEQ